MSDHPHTNGHGNANGQPAVEGATAANGNWTAPTNFNYDTTDDGVNWEHNARVYQWDGDEGDIGPENPELESILFGRPEERGTQGINFQA